MTAVRPMLSRLWPRSLKTRLLGAFLLLSVIPLSAVGIFVYRQGEATLRHHQLDELATVAMLKSQQLTGWVTERQRDVIRPASIPSFFQREIAALARRAGTPEAQAARRRLREILEGIRRVGEFNEMFLLDPVQGQVLLSTDPEQEGKVKNDRPYFREGLKGPHVQHVYYSLALGKAVMAFSAPVPAREGGSAAILVGRVDLRYLDQLMAARAGLGTTGRTFLVNRFNYFVSASLGRGKHGWRPVFSEGVKLALAGQTGTALYVNHEGRAVVGAHRWLPDLGLALIAEVDREEAFAPIKTLRIALTLAAAVVSGLAILVGLTLTWGITRPITQLVEAARAIGEGRLTHRVEVRRPDELATLASTVNRMADDLLRSQRELEAYSQSLEARVEERTLELGRKNVHLQALFETSRRATLSLDLGDILLTLAKAATELVGADASSIRLLDRSGTILEAVARHGLSETFARRGPVKVGEGMTGQIVLDGEPVIAEDVERDQRILHRKELLAEGLRSLVVVPLRSRERIAGVLTVYTHARRRFSPDEVELLSQFGNLAALAIGNARLYEEAQTRLARMRRLTEISHLVASSLDLRQVLDAVTEAALDLVQGDLSRIWVVDEEAGVLRRVAVKARDSDSAGIPSIAELPLGQSLVGWVVEHKIKRYSPNLLDDPLQRHKEWVKAGGYVSQIAVPLLVGEQALGALVVLTKAMRQFSHEEEGLLELFAAKAATALENARLYERLKCSYEELARAQDRLVQSEKLRALGEMAGGVAHDFNNLLTPILGRAQYLMLRLAEGEVAPEEVRKNLGIIERGALDGAETVRRLLEFTRATPRPSEAEAVEARELLASVVEAAEPRWKDEAEARGARIKMVLDARSSRPVVGNPAELREVLLNLVFNAIDAMPEGGRLTLASWDEEGSVCLAVKDTGVGIPEEVRARVFDPFFTTKGPQSSGLGLSVSYGIIRRHGGEIMVDSQPGQGTTFTIRLPVRETPAPRGEAGAQPARRGFRVLAVDDEAEVRHTLRDLLEAVGHEVYEAGSGPEGLEILERQEVDLVCTDLGMPGMNGWEVADRVRARWPGLKVALVSGWGARVEPEELRAHGVDFLIAKPFQVNDLLRALTALEHPRESKRA